jgi:hypothetical protein
MMTTTHPLADDYLRRLERAARALPRRDREDLVADIRAHLDAGLSSDATEADVRNLLDELGPPEEVVGAASPERPSTRRGAREVFALVLLVTGLPPVLGWLAGAGLLLWSPLWTGRQKFLGLLVWPGGYVTLLGLGVVAERSCTAGGPVGGRLDCVSAGVPVWSIVLLVVLAVAPLIVAGYLYRAAGRQAQS